MVASTNRPTVYELYLAGLAFVLYINKMPRLIRKTVVYDYAQEDEYDDSDDSDYEPEDDQDSQDGESAIDSESDDPSDAETLPTDSEASCYYSDRRR